MNGLEFIQKVKALEKYKTIPIIIVSTEGQGGGHKRGLGPGGAGICEKAFPAKRSSFADRQAVRAPRRLDFLPMVQERAHSRILLRGQRAIRITILP